MYLCEAQLTFLASVHLFSGISLTSYWIVCRPCRHATWFFAMEAAILYLPSWKLPYLAHGQLTRMQHGSSSILEFASPKFQTLNTHKCSKDIHLKVISLQTLDSYPTSDTMKKHHEGIINPWGLI